MNGQEATVLMRMIPPEFRGPEFSYTRNNVYRRVVDAGGKVTRQLVGQLEEAAPARLPVEQAARLFGGGGGLALQALSAVGSVASIATLGVCVVGFLHVSRALRRVEGRLEQVEQKLDVVADLVGILDQKVDQLQLMAGAQISALTDLHSLLISFQTSKVHQALETLEFRLGDAPSPHHVAEIMAAAATLHEYRLWLAQTRGADPMRPLAARAELIRAEVLVAIAEARARCHVNDAAFAARELDSVLEGVRAEAAWMRTRLTMDCDLPALLACTVPGVEDMHREINDVWSWLDRCGSAETQRRLFRQTAHAYNDVSQRLRTLGGYAREGMLSADVIRAYRDQGRFDVAMAADSDVASLLVAARLGRNLESAMSTCAAIAVVGKPGLALLESHDAATSQAFSLELVALAA